MGCWETRSLRRRLSVGPVHSIGRNERWVMTPEASGVRWGREQRSSESGQPMLGEQNGERCIALDGW